jgi:hypothetical protein
MGHNAILCDCVTKRKAIWGPLAWLLLGSLRVLLLLGDATNIFSLCLPIIVEKTCKSWLRGGKENAGCQIAIPLPV